MSCAGVCNVAAIPGRGQHCRMDEWLRSTKLWGVSSAIKFGPLRRNHNKVPSGKPGLESDLAVYWSDLYHFIIFVVEIIHSQPVSILLFFWAYLTPRWHFPIFLETRCGPRTKFSKMEHEWKWYRTPASFVYNELDVWLWSFFHFPVCPGPISAHADEYRALSRGLPGQQNERNMSTSMPPIAKPPCTCPAHSGLQDVRGMNTCIL